jgi:hypothetical protein
MMRQCHAAPLQKHGCSTSNMHLPLRIAAQTPSTDVPSATRVEVCASAKECLRCDAGLEDAYWFLQRGAGAQVLKHPRPHDRIGD